jgi:alpha-L-fucosidase
MKLFRTLAFLLVLHLTIPLGFAQNRVVETKLGNGDSRIDIIDLDAQVRESYEINLSTHHYPATSEEDPLVRRIASWKYGAFLCYNSNQYSGSEFCTSEDPVSDFAPGDLDVAQWMETVQNAGMNYAVLTVRHTSDFLLWDSATSEIKSTNSESGVDVVELYVEECRRRDIVPGIYYCLWGGPNRKPAPNARAMILAQLHELATNYGTIPYFWIDMGNWRPDDLSIQEIYDSLKNVSSETVVIFNQHIQDGSEVRYFPTDLLNGEMCSPPPEGHDPYRTVDDVEYYLPFEYEPCSQARVGRFNLSGWDFQRASWFTYGEGKEFASSEPVDPDFLYRHVIGAYELGASTVLLSCAPDHKGRFREQDIEQLNQLRRMLDNPSLAPPMPLTIGGSATSSGDWDEDYPASKAFDGNLQTRWGGLPGTTDGWLAIDLGGPKTFESITIREGWDRIQQFELQIRDGDNWRTIYEGTTIGENFKASFEAIESQHVRLNILEAMDVPTVWEIELFPPDDR